MPVLTLKPDFDGWRNEKALHRTDQYFEVFNQISNLDECQCYFCGYKDGKYLELHHKDGNHENYDPSNLTTICSFCHRTVHFGWACLDNCVSLYYVRNPKVSRGNAEPMPAFDLGFYNLVSRWHLTALLFGKSLKMQNNPEFENLFENVRWLKNTDWERVINIQRHPVEIFTTMTLTPDELDFLAYAEQLDQSQIDEKIKNRHESLKIKEFSYKKMQKTFLEQQESGVNGLIVPKFNCRIFMPFDKRQDYTYNQRTQQDLDNRVLNPLELDKVVYNHLNNIRKSVDRKIAQEQETLNSRLASPNTTPADNKGYVQPKF